MNTLLSSSIAIGKLMLFHRSNRRKLIPNQSLPLPYLIPQETGSLQKPSFYVKLVKDFSRLTGQLQAEGYRYDAHLNDAIGRKTLY